MSVLRRKAITSAAHGLNQSIVAAGREQFAQPQDVDVDGALIDIHIVSPYIIQYLRPTVHTVGVAHEKMQQPELDRTEIEGRAVRLYPVRDRIQNQAVVFQLELAGQRRRPA